MLESKNTHLGRNNNNMANPRKIASTFSADFQPIKNPERTKLDSIRDDEDRMMLIEGLRALRRERAAAWNAAHTVAVMAGTPPPDEELFGLREVTDLMRRLKVFY